MKPRRRAVLFCAMALSATLVAGCAGTTDGPEGSEGPEVEDLSSLAQDLSASGASTQSIGDASAFAGKPWLNPDLQNPDSPLSQRVVYFDYDSSEIRPEDQPVLRAHAEFLASASNLNVVLEGHADERGTREYNIGLGEHRARAVEEILLLQGAAGGQMRLVSFGEEKPVASGHEQQSWWQNRRVELVYREF